MEVAYTGRIKASRNVGHQYIVGLKKSRYHYEKSIEVNEKMVEEMRQQMFQIEKQLIKKILVREQDISGLENNLHHRWRVIEDDRLMVNFPNCPKKMELDKLTFTNNAYRGKKAAAVISFSSGEREINIHDRNQPKASDVTQAKAHCMDSDRRLLKMLNPNKDTEPVISLAQVKEQMRKLYCSMKWPYLNSTSTSTMDEETYERKLRELECERDQVFVNAPSKASLWKLLPSTKDLRNQIKAMEAKDEEKRKKVLKRRKKIESRERKIKETENEIKSMRKMLDRIHIRKQKALETISHERTCLETIIT
ncbi:PREDICTED: rac guanine nucleotide exchange factor JJ-like [Camelina sativa]|uniref:Rac guanine nucleotide exchange factor JJ-like n=1 Tax=Camelina sativa TaxID=90675 RepID=A0ABM1RIU5_CAMSA|nr:PREDICTED: rac guanine nucleotide exchange factor JJ-like [Camelina sativa]XP_019098933.1 PREDICTED: rac guanine nucleotide exchange factor JJ-like [Camelina sativa]